MYVMPMTQRYYHPFNLLQLSTGQLEEACKKFGLKINGDKCRVISEEESKDILVDNNAVKKSKGICFPWISSTRYFK